MTPLRILVVDDEPVAARRLTTLVHRTVGVEAAATANGAAAALDLAEGFRPNLLLLDIDMPGMDGLDLAARFDRAAPPAIIFVTAFSQYAIDAFNLAAVDYLLKPVDAARLSEALKRARQRLDANSAGEDMRALKDTITALRAAESAHARDAFLWIGSGQSRQRLPIKSILWVEAERDYVRLHEATRSHLVRASISEIAGKLPAGEFARLRRSALVRLSSIDRIHRKGERGYFIVLSTGAAIRVGRSYLKDMPALLKTLRA